MGINTVRIPLRVKDISSPLTLPLFFLNPGTVAALPGLVHFLDNGYACQAGLSQRTRLPLPGLPHVTRDAVCRSDRPPKALPWPFSSPCRSCEAIGYFCLYVNNSVTFIFAKLT
jgi:hypothetical protein